MTSFKELVVWQKSRKLVKDVYILCGQLPESEKFGLISQMQRSSVSIPSNIAEGYRRRNVNEYLHFLSIAAGSAAELETQIILSNDLYKIEVNEVLDLLLEVQKMLSSLHNKLDPKA
jgi:four helix bundle protein